ncbi:MAG TPA: hypothetical protein VLA36_07525, partial [Longimicrobiales bacterium]|nr:hypothetical protein [Longimicrobiales bacterium]
RREQPQMHAVAGERHRFRLINISPAGFITARITRDGVPVQYRLLAKDGADLPPHQQVLVESLARIGAGETADFTWTPTEPGVYELAIGSRPDVPGRALVQRWVVEAAPGR